MKKKYPQEKGVAVACDRQEGQGHELPTSVISVLRYGSVNRGRLLLWAETGLFWLFLLSSDLSTHGLFNYRPTCALQ